MKVRYEDQMKLFNTQPTSGLNTSQRVQSYLNEALGDETEQNVIQGPGQLAGWSCAVVNLFYYYFIECPKSSISQT
jgi:hypothetical protein